MPTYQYKCSECENSFEEIYRVADRNIPVGSVCSKCGTGEISLYPARMSIVSMQGSWRSHTSDGWKDRLKEISRNNPGNSLDV